MSELNRYYFIHDAKWTSNFLMWMNNCYKQSHTYLHKYTQFSSSIYSEKCQPWPVLGLVSEICHNNFSCYYYHFWHSLHFKKVSWCISQLPVYFWNSWWGTRGSPSRDGRFCAADHLDDLIDMSWECRRRPDTLHGVNLCTRITLLAPYFLSVAF